MILESDTNIEVLDGGDAIKWLEESWKMLVDKSPTATIFQTFEWHQSWWEAIGCYHSEIYPQIIRLFNKNKTIGILPLMRVSIEGKSVLRFLSSPVADYHDILTDGQIPIQNVYILLQALFEGLIEVDAIELDELRPESILRKCAEFPLKIKGINLEPSSINPYIELTHPIYQQIINKRQYIRKEKKLKADYGSIYFESHTDIENIAKYLPSFFEMHSKQWCLRNDIAGSFLEKENVRFFELLAERLSKRKWLSFSRLLVKNNVIAQDFSFLFRNTISTYRSTLLRECADYSPGHILLKHIFSQAWNTGIQEIDMLRGEYPYKYDYATNERKSLRIRTRGTDIPLARADGIVILPSLRASVE